MTDCILRISCQKRIFLLCHYFFDWLINELEWYNRWHYLEVSIWYFLLHLSSCSGSLLTLRVHPSFKIVVKTIDVILKPCKWRWRSLALWKWR